VAVLMKRFGLDEWSPEDRLELVDELLVSVTFPSHPLLTDAHKGDLRRRLEANTNNPKAGSPWELVRARLIG
jgi:putative addiction module component (TIGR02574 family)